MKKRKLKKRDVSKFKNNGSSNPFTITDRAEQFHKYEPVICRHFGCGRHLTLQEGLFGPVCSDHTGEEIINKTLMTYLVGRN